MLSNEYVLELSNVFHTGEVMFTFILLKKLFFFSVISLCVDFIEYLKFICFRLFIMAYIIHNLCKQKHLSIISINKPQVSLKFINYT